MGGERWRGAIQGGGGMWTAKGRSGRKSFRANGATTAGRNSEKLLSRKSNDLGEQRERRATMKIDLNRSWDTDTPSDIETEVGTLEIPVLSIVTNFYGTALTTLCTIPYHCYLNIINHP